jgi:hypothetical protein
MDQEPMLRWEIHLHRKEILASLPNGTMTLFMTEMGHTSSNSTLADSVTVKSSDFYNHT